MRRNTRKRSKTVRRATAAAAALAMGAGGLVAANVYASAGESGSGAEPEGTRQVLASGDVTIACPDVGVELRNVPDRVRKEVDKNLALLDQQVAEAYQRLRSESRAVRQQRDFADNAIVGPLTAKRTAAIDRIAIAIGRVADRPQGLESLAACTLRASGNQDGGGQDGGGEQGGAGGQAGNGPVAADFVDITTVQPAPDKPRTVRGGSRGTFTSSCGVNENKLYNTDNIIVAPGVSNGAHHTHDYIGNQANDAFADDRDFANGETTCENPGDKSSYYWPVLRLQDGTDEFDADQPGGGAEGNVGRILTAKEATLEFVGNPRSKVVAMPKFLRIITGDAKAFTNGTANANASWSCTGFEDRQLTDKYPLCPEGSDVVRTSTFQSCWDGRNTDSANHRSHVAFTDPRTGACPSGFQAIPQLVQRLVYDVDAPSLNDNGRSTPFFAVDGFPEQLHKPVTDHGDFVNVFEEGLMDTMVRCINTGRGCR
ncbi:DUF1996 domain-containing protein [Streptomyces sp. F63]|uniref:DUF1996 domain-containing protein n=1 Tax=Streptomyces sp. F63 TaxID=2824887 RepID=UPI001B35EFB1|nr:DUF1996 domain-containing protein [Streptomyces sp. F63]MBQ0988074.1 DUF1996 domain-containing protein [Streptomyces sp. F63]